MGLRKSIELHESLFFCQWRECDEMHHLQFKTRDLLKVLKRLESEFKQSVESVMILKTGVIQVNFEDLCSVYILTSMDELIDCEVLQ